VINVFLLDYYTRLREWFKLKERLVDQDLSTICVEVDTFWQKVPLATCYLHPDDIESWPNPWELINDNYYCYYARALGMIYTLLLLGVKDIDFVEAVDYNNNDVVLVLVDNAKYVMNYWPDTVLNNSLTEFVVKKRIGINPLIKKIGSV
jgi:hypothetical protein